MNNVLDNKIVWITGGASGIGFALTNIFLKNGAYVFVTGRREFTELINNDNDFKEISSHNKLIYYQCDVSKKDEVNNVYENIINTKGKVDILINNAGIGIFKSFINTTDEDFDLMNEVNFRGAYYCTKSVINQMINSKNGYIVNILSVAVLEKFTNSSIYAASKSALLTMSRVLREEVRKDNIKILDVFPGATATPIWNPKVLEKHSHKMMDNNSVANTISSTIINSISNNTMIEELVIKPQIGNL